MVLDSHTFQCTSCLGIFNLAVANFVGRNSLCDSCKEKMESEEIPEEVSK